MNFRQSPVLGSFLAWVDDIQAYPSVADRSVIVNVQITSLPYAPKQAKLIVRATGYGVPAGTVAASDVQFDQATTQMQITRWQSLN